MVTGRNDPCPCGSGLKSKRCCGVERPSEQRSWRGIVGVVVGMLFAAGLAFAVLDLFFPDDAARSTKRVWSKEHKHWHNVQDGEPGAQPPGPAPPGKVWSEEHGHWHDAP